MSLIDIDEDIFWTLDEFAEECVLTSQDGARVVSTRGIYEDATMKEADEEGYASHRSFHPHVTCPKKQVGDFTEGDTLTIRGQSYIILDELFDDTQITFTLEE